MIELPDAAIEGDGLGIELGEELADTDEDAAVGAPAADPVMEFKSPPEWALQLADVLEQVRMEASMFRERARAQEDLIQRMQSRIEDLQGDQVRSLLGPVVTELAGLHANLAEAASLDYERLGVGRVAREFSFLADRLEGSLELLDVVSIGARPGDPFDSRLHMAARRVPTVDRALDGTIAAVQRQGFRFAREAKTTLYARVTVYSYDASLEVEGAAEPAVAGTVPAEHSDAAESGGSLDQTPDATVPVDPTN